MAAMMVAMAAPGFAQATHESPVLSTENPAQARPSAPRAATSTDNARLSPKAAMREAAAAVGQQSKVVLGLLTANRPKRTALRPPVRTATYRVTSTPSRTRRESVRANLRVLRRGSAFSSHLRRTPIWRSSRSGHSRKFALKEFSEVELPLSEILGSWGGEEGPGPLIGPRPFSSLICSCRARDFGGTDGR